MSYLRYKSSSSPVANRENGYNNWYDECSCCPYGYHIDLDFVRYCESISKEEKNRTGSIKRRKDRRKQRQSMEMLLGLTPPILAVLDEACKNHEQDLPKIHQKQTQQSSYTQFNNDFDDAVSDFERTFHRSKNKLSNNLPDVTAVSAPTATTTTDNQDGQLKTECEFTGAIESNGLSSTALQNIREALALSLERTKQLERQVKLIPDLQDEVLLLKNENQRLNLQLKSNDSSQLNIFLNNSSTTHCKRSQSFTHIDNFNEDIKKEIPPPPPPRKDFGVMCGVLTRNIGVGHQNPDTKDATTATDFADKWLTEKVKFLNTVTPENFVKTTTSKTSQTYIKQTKDMGIQYSLQLPTTIKFSRYSQTDSVLKPTINMGIMAVPRVSDVSIQKYVDCRSVACSDNTINDVLCNKCNVLKRTIGVGMDKNEDVFLSPIFSSTSSRSKSFNLGQDKLDLCKRTRTVSTQIEHHFNSTTKSSQCEIKTSSKSSQHDLKFAEKQTQHEIDTSSKSTDTQNLKTSKSVACETIQEVKPRMVEKGNNTINEEKEVSEEKICAKCASKEMELSKEFKKYEPGSPTPSRIPIPAPTDARKFRRQDTYTKVYSSSSEKSPTKLSGLDLSTKAASSDSISTFDKVKQNLKLNVTGSTASNSQNNLSSSASFTKIQGTTLPVSESTIFQPPIENRKKAIPSKEMQGALKVLNDSLQKSPSKVVKNQRAINIVQQEWFNMSSLNTANPLTVEDYLDAFEDISSILLQYVVNMTDTSGNTAMHYAVSHGNFDVVSILLDSKVCDINKANKAGYTSVMLVSLAEIRSDTHATVIKRLFQLADVNIRAFQHGQTALMLAVSHGRLDMVKMLLEAGADINIQDEDGSTALMCAAEHGHIEIVKYFLSQPDCDSSITDVDGSTALKIAMEAGHRNIGILLYAHERNFQKSHNKLKKTKSNSPKTPSSPLPIRSSPRALTDTKK